VVFYGDSLLVESRGVVASELATLAPGYRVLTSGRSFGGTALCDWGAQMQADGNENVRLVVIQFSGNNLTPCAAGLTGVALESWYRFAAEWTVSLWSSRGAKVLFVGSPTLVVDDVNPQPPNPISEVFRSVAEANPAWAAFDDGPALALSSEPPADPPPDTTTTTEPTTTSSTTATSSTTTTSSSTTTTTEPEVTTQTQPDAPPIGLEAVEPLPVGAAVPAGWRLFPFELPCLSASEPGCGQFTPGLAAVRWAPPSPGSPTGNGHLCTGIPMTLASDATCPEYRSGVQRFGRAIALAVAGRL
jgi:hypothetical protein